MIGTLTRRICACCRKCRLYHIVAGEYIFFYCPQCDAPPCRD